MPGAGKQPGAPAAPKGAGSIPAPAYSQPLAGAAPIANRYVTEDPSGASQLPAPPTPPQDQQAIPAANTSPSIVANPDAGEQPNVSAISDGAAAPHAQAASTPAPADLQSPPAVTPIANRYATDNPSSDSQHAAPPTTLVATTPTAQFAPMSSQPYRPGGTGDYTPAAIGYLMGVTQNVAGSSVHTATYAIPSAIPSKPVDPRPSVEAFRVEAFREVKTVEEDDSALSKKRESTEEAPPPLVKSAPPTRSPTRPKPRQHFVTWANEGSDGWKSTRGSKRAQLSQIYRSNQEPSGAVITAASQSSSSSSEADYLQTSTRLTNPLR